MGKPEILNPNDRIVVELLLDAGLDEPNDDLEINSVRSSIPSILEREFSIPRWRISVHQTNTKASC